MSRVESKPVSSTEDLLEAMDFALDYFKRVHQDRELSKREYEDLADYYRKINGKVGTNVAHQIPHNTLRRAVMGEANRAPTSAELTRMKISVTVSMSRSSANSIMPT